MSQSTGTRSLASERVRLERIERRLRTVLEDLLKEAHRRGCENPMIFIEPECGVYVLDRDHPSYKNAAELSGGRRKEAVVMRLLGALPADLDAGAW